MLISHFFLILLVVLIWGINFVFIKFGLDEISPLLLCALRFLFASIPAVFFIKPPAVPIKILLAYGIIMFALQFTFLFIGMDLGMPASMAAILIQFQVFFSIFFAAILLKEIPTIWQILGAVIAFLGIGIIGIHIDENVTLAGILFILAASATWGIGNLITRKNSNINMMALVIWGSFVASIPMIIFSLLLEGPSTILEGYSNLTWLGLLSIFYITYASTWMGYGIWNWLLRYYSVGTIAPFTLLVPIVALMSSALILNETLELWKIMAGILVISGLCINLFGPFVYRKLTSVYPHRT